MLFSGGVGPHHSRAVSRPPREILRPNLCLRRSCPRAVQIPGQEMLTFRLPPDGAGLPLWKAPALPTGGLLERAPRERAEHPQPAGPRPPAG
jgi:hypothetical protein